MNFKLTLFIVLIISSSCGVKQAPLRSSDKLIPSYIEEFEQKNQQQPPPAISK